MNSETNSKSILKKMNRLCWTLGMVLSIAFVSAGVAQAQVPEDIEAGLLKIGHVVDPPCTAKLYRSLMPQKDIVDQLAEMQQTGKPSTQVTIYPGITVSRDISFGPNPKDVVDVFTADKGPVSRPVLMYVPGGAGNKQELQDKEANAFYDNIARWATENGMVGVLMQRHGAVAAPVAPGAPPDPPDFYAGGKDVAAMIKWVQENISKYHGNPNMMFIWAQSAGNGPLGIYIGHPELYPPKGVGVRGVIFMSGQFSILRPDGTNPAPLAQPGAGGGRGGAGGGAPAAGAGAPAAGAPGGAPAAPAGGAAPAAGGGGGRGGAAPSVCGVAGGNGGTEGAIPGRAPGQPGGPNVANAGGGGGGGGRGGAPIPMDEQIKRSSLPALEKTNVKLFLASAGLDPGVDGNMAPFNRALHDELCKLDGPNAKNGVGHCPMTLFELGESHMSEVFSIDTPDTTVSGPILAWIKGVERGLSTPGALNGVKAPAKASTPAK